MKSALFSILFTLVTFSVTVFTASAQLDHSAYSAVLGSHVRDGRVDYAGIKKDGRFAPYLASLSSTKASGLKGADRLAFWINVYNAFTIKLISDNFPLKSIRDLSNGKVWDRPLVTIEQTTYSLNEIENDLIRPLGDNRIHFALVCAARSCPPLLSEAYTAANVDSLLDLQAQRFLNDPALNRFDNAAGKAYLSHVFEWYLADFGKTHADLLRTISRYLQQPIRARLEKEPKAWTIVWNDYDWSLNGK